MNQKYLLSILKSLWTKPAIFWGIAIVLMSIAAIHRIGNEFWRLLWETGESGAIDLKTFHVAVQLWFSKEKVYGELWSAVYPPASYAMLWPFLGWLDVTAARGFGLPLLSPSLSVLFT